MNPCPVQRRNGRPALPILAALVTGILAAPPPSAARIQGDWWVQTMEGNGSWTRGEIVIWPGGFFSGVLEGSDGGSELMTGDLKARIDGSVVTPSDPHFAGAMRPEGDMMIATSGTGTNVMILGTVRVDAGTYTQSDLTGTWALHALAVGPAGARWVRGRIAIDTAGIATGWTVDNEGNGGGVSDTITISPNGRIGMGSDPEWQGALCRGRDVFLGVQTDGSDRGEFDILVRVPGACPLALLKGRHALQGLAANGASLWTRGHLAAGGSGNFSLVMDSSDGGHDSTTGTFGCEPDLAISLVGETSWAAAAAPAGSLLVGTSGESEPHLFCAIRKPPEAFRMLSVQRSATFLGNLLYLTWTSNEAEAYEVLVSGDPPGPAEVWGVLPGSTPGQPLATTMILPEPPGARLRYRVRMIEP